MIRGDRVGMLMLVWVASGLWSGVAQADEPLHWAFQVYLDGRPIGEQRFTVAPEGEERRVDIQARFEVDFLFFNAYDYRHHNTERWRGDCLETLEAQTDDNGTRYRLRGSRQGEHFGLEVNGQVTTLPGCVMSFAYWNPAILTQTRLLNTQDGRFMAVSVMALGEETLDVVGMAVPAERFRLTAEDLTIDLWYARDDRRWLKLESLIDGARLVFQLQAPHGPAARLP